VVGWVNDSIKSWMVDGREEKIMYPSECRGGDKTGDERKKVNKFRGCGK